MEATHQETWIHLLLSLSRYIDAQVCRAGQHSMRVAHWAVSLAERLHLDGRLLNAMYWAALLHDIGKVGVPMQILSKNGPLTDDEWVLMKLHPAIGANMVKSLKVLTDIAPFIHSHQEKFNGSGYPEGLAGKDIPLGARILTIVDAYEAMTTDRSYRTALSHEAAIVELRAQVGKHFDPELVERFLELVNEQEIQ